MLSAIIDACVLYPAPLRDFFMRLAVSLYQPKWTDDIHEEWIRNVLEDRPDLNAAQLQRTRELMDRHGGDCLVGAYKDLIPSLTLPDMNDRHVLAAAIASKASLIVTFNLSDFPSRVLSDHNIRAIHPDKFALHLYDSDPREFFMLVRRHRQALKNPSKSPEEYLSTLLACGLAETASRLRGHMDEI